MNIIKPILSIIGETTYLDNYTEVVDSFLYDFDKVDSGDMVSYYKGGRSVHMFKTTYKGLVRWELERNTSRINLRFIYEDLVATFGDMKNEVNSTFIDQPFYAFDTKKEIHISITDKDVVIHNTELECLVFDIIHGI